jgi:murein DD-endopeptidase
MTAWMVRTIVFSLALAGCASLPPAAETLPPAEQALAHALKMVGRPYRFGGASPAGFDCSGLVQYSFRQAGVALPRKTEEQRLAASPVALTELRPGDLIFFDHQGIKNSHVGIYAGGGQFVHAPSTGKDVRRDRLDQPYWKRNVSEARRPTAP